MAEQIGTILVGKGKLGARDLERALLAQREMGDLIGRVLVKLGLISEQDLVESLSEQLGIVRKSADQFPEQGIRPAGVTFDFLESNLILPLSDDAETLHVAMAQPQDDYSVKALRLATGKNIVCSIASETELANAFDRIYEEQELFDETYFVDGGLDGDDEFVEHLRDLATEAPVISLVNKMISQAVDLGASDIHVEPTEENMQIRYRVDGVLQHGEAPPTGLGPALLSRIKLLARLNIAERRLPQDGRIKTRVKGHELDLRVSTVPTANGESVVMRVLDRSSIQLSLEDMGFSPDTLAPFNDLLKRPHGILLVTGPTGSGKTTTLYAALAKLDADSQKIVTVEDPVEYQLAGINQIQVQPQIELTFARALRAILRQDPDIIMIGEMRDTETAQIAVQSSLTGHLVLSTLHTNTAAGAIARLEDMGVERYLITSTVSGVLAQRLVRTLCSHCKKPYDMPESARAQSGLQAFMQEHSTLYMHVGCDACNHTGYAGRTAIHELFVMNPAMHRAILDGRDATILHSTARREGMITLYEDGLRKVASGKTTLEEVLRVTQDSFNAEL